MSFQTVPSCVVDAFSIFEIPLNSCMQAPGPDDPDDLDRKDVLWSKPGISPLSRPGRPDVEIEQV